MPGRRRGRAVGPDLRVHLHTDCYWFGGSEHTPLLLLRAARAGRFVDLTYSYRSDPAYDEGFVARGGPGDRVLPIRLPDPADEPVRWRRLLLRNRLAVLAWDIVRLTVVLRRTQPDVLHVNNGGWPAAVSCQAAVLAGWIARVPAIVYVANNLAVGYESRLRRIERPVDRLVAARVDRFATASAFAGRRLEEVLGLEPGSVRALPNGVVRRADAPTRDVARIALGVPANAVVLAVVARLERRKGHAVLLRAMVALADRTDLVLLVAGDGPEAAALGADVERSGLGGVVRLLGQVADAWEVIAAADVVVLPSIGDEDFPITILEAMSAGRAIVATRVAGVPEQVEDGVTALLADPGDVLGLERALVEVCDDAALRTRLGAAARDRFDARFSEDGVVERYLAFYEEVAG